MSITSLRATKVSPAPLLTFALRPELRATLRLGSPLALAEIGWMSTYLVDAVMVGRLPEGAAGIAASSLGNTIFYAIVFFGVGLLYGLDTLVAQAFGREDRQSCLFFLAQSTWLILLWAPMTSLLLLATGPLLRWDGIEPSLAAQTLHYVNALHSSAIPLMNKLFGHLGAPRLGLAGSGWATGIVRLYMLGILVFAFVRQLRRDRLKLTAGMFLPSAEPLRALFRLGWAPAIQTMADLGVSTAQTLLCGRLGAVALAVNQVVLDVAAFVYMVPLGIGQGATPVRVGQTVGAGHRPGVGLATRAGSWICVLFAGAAAILFVACPKLLASIYTVDPAVISASVAVFAIAALYQPFDAWEACLSGSLRGLGDTRTPMLAGVLWSWVIGLPLTWWLTLHTPLGLYGLWIGRGLPAICTAINVALVWRSRFDTLYPPPRSHPPKSQAGAGIQRPRLA